MDPSSDHWTRPRLTSGAQLGNPRIMSRPAQNPLPIVLASASPRRRELLRKASVAFDVQPANIAELERDGETPTELAERLATEKALTVARRLGPEPRRRVLGADTIVVLDDEVLGKPRDSDHALELLGRLTGRRHRVVTGIAVVDSATLRVASRTVESWVSMRSASREELVAYVSTGESLDKAGGYAVQGGARSFVTEIHGSETNVIGLPIAETLALIESMSDETAGAR
ncbi:MAG: Maf family protein [Myxococcota bacterium]